MSAPRSARVEIGEAGANDGNRVGEERHAERTIDEMHSPRVSGAGEAVEWRQYPGGECAQCTRFRGGQMREPRVPTTGVAGTAHEELELDRQEAGGGDACRVDEERASRN